MFVSFRPSFYGAFYGSPRVAGAAPQFGSKEEIIAALGSTDIPWDKFKQGPKKSVRLLYIPDVYFPHFDKRLNMTVESSGSGQMLTVYHHNPMDDRDDFPIKTLQIHPDGNVSMSEDFATGEEFSNVDDDFYSKVWSALKKVVLK